MLYPQNGDRTVAIDFVTSLHPVYKDKNNNTTWSRRQGPLNSSILSSGDSNIQHWWNRHYVKLQTDRPHL